MNKSEMKSYINLLFASKHLTEKEFQDLLTKVSDLRNGKNLNLSLDINWFIKNTKADDELKDELMITEQINDQLYDFLKGNPRQVKRFINTLILRMKMASIRGVDLKKQVLAKLMALEYMNVGYFRQLADWQSIQAGKPKEISALETQVNSKTKQKDEEDSTGWLENDWVKKWLKAEPLLRDENLEPYFYISRDAINSFATLILELTEQEKQIFDLLVSPSEVHKTKGKKLFESVSDTEAINITKAIIDKCSKSDLNVENKGLPLTTVSLMYRKANVSDNILDYINTVDEEFIEPAIILELKEAQKKASASVNIKITALLDKFRKSTNAMLAKAVDS